MQYWGACCGAVCSGTALWLLTLSMEFFMTWSFWPHYGCGVDSASNRNEYQGYFLGSKTGRYVGLTTSPPSHADCFEIWETQPLGTLKACPSLYRIALPLLFTMQYVNATQACGNWDKTADVNNRESNYLIYTECKKNYLLITVHILLHTTC